MKIKTSSFKLKEQWFSKNVVYNKYLLIFKLNNTFDYLGKRNSLKRNKKDQVNKVLKVNSVIKINLINSRYLTLQL
jgi:hypothetical protein